MRSNSRRNHMIDLLFPIILFLIFTISAVVVILLATRIYESTTGASVLNDTARTSLSYVSEKIHQSDSTDCISLGTFDGCESLIMTHSDERAGYTTYIYVYENQLKELFIKNGVTATASAGKTILQVQDFHMEEISDRLLRISSKDAGGRVVSTLVGLRSTSER